MCGIAGLWERRGRTAPDALAAVAKAMTDALVHRGPDAGDVWLDPEAGLALGHRRLSIIDLSPAGAQPMVSSCGRFVISYNGEVYNADELRPELEAAGRRFRGHSDTEVIVEGAAVWGVEATVKRLIGMFAMALWDRRERISISCATVSESSRFTGPSSTADCCSVPNSRRCAPTGAGRRNSTATRSCRSCVSVTCRPPIRSIAGSTNCRPGRFCGRRPAPRQRSRRIGRFKDIARQGQSDRFPGDDGEAADALDTLLRDAIGRRMVADVPLGAFLSGGINSSTVVALMQAQSTRPVRTFSIGFHEQEYNEGENAAAVARHLGTEHTELYAEPRHALDVIPLLADMYDEPFANSSQLPTHLVSKMTRAHVTVALSGDGGDELFAGYTRYFRGQGLWQAIDATPRPLRALAARGIWALPPSAWSAVAEAIPEQRRPAQFGDKMHKLAGVLAGEPEASAFYRQIVSQWADPASVVRGARERPGLLEDTRVRSLVPDFVERMQYLDTLTYLPDDILTKVDRASMAVSLEARVPLLDHRVVAFSWSLPPEMKAGGGVGKRLLRRVLHRYVPRELVDRPKKGFAVPLDRWLRCELRSWAENLLDARRLEREDILDSTAIRRRWAEHLDGKRNWQASLWAVLMFQAWKERWLA